MQCPTHWPELAQRSASHTRSLARLVHNKALLIDLQIKEGKKQKLINELPQQRRRRAYYLIN